MTRLRIISSSQDRYFSLWLDDEILNDSLLSIFTTPVKVGKQRLRIAEAGKSEYFVDTLVDITRPMTSFSLLEADPSLPPFLFTGFGEDVAPPAAGNYKFCFLNIDTLYTKNKLVNIKLIDWDMVTVLDELKDIPFNRLSGYYEVSGNIMSNCIAEIVDAADPANVLLSRESYSAFSPILFNPGNNIFILKFYFAGDASVNYNYYSFEEIFSEKR